MGQLSHYHKSPGPCSLLLLLWKYSVGEDEGRKGGKGAREGGVGGREGWERGREVVCPTLYVGHI